MTLISQSLSIQLMTISIITLQRQLLHNEASNRNQWNNTYDYVVVGAGSAGAIVAARLTEDPNLNVLLVEAGGPQTVISDMIGNAFNEKLGESDWQYMTTPQSKAGHLYPENRIHYPMGRALGGSSTTGMLLYNRGNRRDYDNWANRFGATGWAYRDVLPYFMRTENQTNPLFAANSAYHSTTGQMPVSSPPNPDPILLRFMEAWNREGFSTIDLNGPTQIGTSLVQHMAFPTNWTRASTASVFIEPLIRNRNNLHVICHSLVTRVLLQNRTNGLTATGVEFQRNGNTYTVSVRREVILSAGAINSPQILMLSGIGPKQHLQDMRIPVQLDLPVGNNLMDHLMVPIDYTAFNVSDVYSSEGIDRIMSVQNLYDYYVNKNGPLIQMPFAFTYYSSRFNDNPEWPDGIITAFTSQISSNISDTIRDTEHVQDAVEYMKNVTNDRRHFEIAFCVFRPRSKGTVRLASTDPREAPLIDPNYFGDSYDLGVVVDAIVTGMRITEQSFFSQYAEVYKRDYPGCHACDSGPTSQCYSYLMCMIRTGGQTFYDPVGTCRMGNASDPEAVVDNQLRVRGVSGLRVIDASIMPEIPNANTNAASMMIGERGSDWVRFGR